MDTTHQLGEIIMLNRGDTLMAPLILSSGTILNPVPYTLEITDTIYFALMEPNQFFEDAILKKVYTSDSLKDEDGNIIINLKSEDTQDLLPGTYYYTIKLVSLNIETNDIIVTTLVPQRKFCLLPA